MPSQGGRGFRPGGVVRALIRLFVLVVFGFGAGLLFGVVSEEPELLAGHLRGESESVDWTANDSSEVRAEIAAVAHVEVGGAASEATERPGRELLRGRSLPAFASPTSKTPPTPSAMRATKFAGQSPQSRAGEVSRSEDARPWAIQVGAFSDERAALRLAESLRAKGYPTKLLSARGDGGRWRVRVQPMSGETKARETATRLKRVERLPTWVLPMEAS